MLHEHGRSALTCACPPHVVGVHGLQAARQRALDLLPKPGRLCGAGQAGVVWFKGLQCNVRRAATATLCMQAAGLPACLHTPSEHPQDRPPGVPGAAAAST